MKVRQLGQTGGWCRLKARDEYQDVKRRGPKSPPWIQKEERYKDKTLRPSDALSKLALCIVP